MHLYMHDRGHDLSRHRRKTMEFKPYCRKVHYYETDKMGITHHSNYIRWMEEARIDFLEQLGWGFDRLEALGLLSPVLSVNCCYQESTRFRDEVCIRVAVREFRGVKLFLEYEMTNAKNGHQVLTGTTQHCFLDTSFRPVRLKKEFPELNEILCRLAKDRAEGRNLE